MLERLVMFQVSIYKSVELRIFGIRKICRLHFEVYWYQAMALTVSGTSNCRN